MEISFYTKWVASGREYKQGVDFYLKYGSNNTLKALFQSGANIYTKEKLDSELRAISVLVPERKISKYNRDDFPLQLQTEFDKLGELIRKIGYLHAQLAIVRTNSDRFKIAKDVLKLVEQRRNIFNRLDEFKTTGKDLLPIEIKKEIPEYNTENVALKALQLKDEARRLRVQRSKLKSNKKRVADYNYTVTRIAEIDMELIKLTNGAV
ncbi:MAG: hypothetical protein A3F72_02985 [Bacteroidetes bacterium RIFCSPLOWO2_12_FULL_35_15]|nr:MAG: hypothetical protein A3F72_02985 [Bacteroidetes bacterium RIFCSPLOWO2_12_FULL_35_15]